MIIALILFAVINETMGIAYIGTAAVCDLKLSTSDKGLLSSMTFIGEILVFSSHIVARKSRSQKITLFAQVQRVILYKVIQRKL